MWKHAAFLRLTPLVPATFEQAPSPKVAGRARSNAFSPVPHTLTSSFLRRARTTTPRNKQVGFASTTQREEHNGWFTCSHCDFLTRRKGDFDRHVRTHFALSRGPEWVCCGVPEEDAPGHSGEKYEHGGRRMKAGCLRPVHL
ncbi:uncharacterized protein B0H18DRAFT_1120693 [Fomitopsis serialis]|uniref:uncharacterized protein n=1 Tax=Fomitopsis serialis TaxID=139415 RepID=UPI0020073D75|nr:uncharacterized protein B0H18DRAFT_1120693 [Neoantrodia serialis]KAH9922986.1 hypothetical protein B0H18DRAFT_1120693 [Neoantrodia serialis]